MNGDLGLLDRRRASAIAAAAQMTDLDRDRLRRLLDPARLTKTRRSGSS